MIKILITGSSGFVNQNLIEFFENKSDFITSTLSLRLSDWENFNFNSFNSIIHLAGKAHDTKNSCDPSEYFIVNRDLTKILFDKFLESNVKDFFYFSSVKAVADTLDGVLTEDAIPLPKTPYGKSKLEAEQYLLSKNIPFGKRIFIIRPCMIHGPGNKGNLNLLYSIVKRGFPWPLGNFQNKRSYLNVDNLCFLIEQMHIDKNVNSGVYNFADDGDISTNELIEIISYALGKKNKIWKFNKKIIIGLAKIGDKIKIPLNSERLKKLTETYLVSNDKIKRELGIKALPFEIREGLIKTVKSFKL